MFPQHGIHFWPAGWHIYCGNRRSCGDKHPRHCRIIAAFLATISLELERLLREAPVIAAISESERLLTDLAMSHRTGAVRALLAAGMPVDARAANGATALHWACWKGYADLAKLLLDHGASLTAEDDEFHGTPPGWFGHGATASALSHAPMNRSSGDSSVSAPRDSIRCRRRPE